MHKSVIAIAWTTACFAFGCGSAPSTGAQQPTAAPVTATATMDAPAPAPAAAAAAPMPTAGDSAKATLPASGGGAAPSQAGGAGGACKYVGTWVTHIPVGPLKGQAITWTINADGTSGGQVGSTGTVKSTWQMSGTTLTTTDVSGTPPTAACPPSMPGKYTMSFSADCNTSTLNVQSDSCLPRQMGINNNPFKRQ